MVKPVKVKDFAVVEDTEREIIVDCGEYLDCVESAITFNRVYQSSAYVARRWINGQ